MTRPIIRNLRLIDGFPPQPARQVKAALHGTATRCIGGCCATHGSDPYICCRCGAEWVPA